MTTTHQPARAALAAALAAVCTFVTQGRITTIQCDDGARQTIVDMSLEKERPQPSLGVGLPPAGHDLGSSLSASHSVFAPYTRNTGDRPRNSRIPQGMR